MTRLLRRMLPLFTLLLLATPLHAAGGTIAVHVPEMSCESCAAALVGNFSKRAEVASVAADIPTQMLTITLKPDATLDAATVRDVVAASGFSAGQITPPAR